MFESKSLTGIILYGLICGWNSHGEFSVEVIAFVFFPFFICSFVIYGFTHREVMMLPLF